MAQRTTTPKRPVALRLDPDLVRRIDERAERLGIDRTAFLTDAATVRLEAQYREALYQDPCSYCGSDAQALDHIQSRSRGGDDGWQNLAAACTSCNSSKHAKPLLMALLGPKEKDGFKKILLRLTEEEHAKLKLDAKASGLSMNDYSRQVLLGSEPAISTSTTPVAAYNALSQEVQTLNSQYSNLNEIVHNLALKITQGQALLEGGEDAAWQPLASPAPAKPRSKRSSR